ncbi:MAG: hypothetical protein AAGN82_14255 [Myxococcota bacterium]
MNSPRLRTIPPLRWLLIVGLGIAGCQSTPPAAPPAAPSPVAVVPVVAAPVAPTVRASAGTAATAATPDAARVPEVPPAAEPTEEACAGDRVDLRRIQESGRCRTPRGARKQPAPEGALVSRIAPEPLDVASGAQREATLAIRNVTSEPLTFDLNVGCALGKMKVAIHDAAGERVDLVTKCGRGSGCGGPTERLTLEPQGEAVWAFTVKATTVVEDDACQPGPERPMTPGRYRVEVRMPFGPPPAEAALLVR